MSIKVEHWQDPLNVILGLWMVASPWVLAHQAESVPIWNAVIVGLAVAVVAAVTAVRAMAWEEWVNVLLGAWLAISPWILAFDAIPAAMWNAVIVGGAVVAALAIWTLATDNDIGGWWSPAT